MNENKPGKPSDIKPDIIAGPWLTIILASLLFLVGAGAAGTWAWLSQPSKKEDFGPSIAQIRKELGDLQNYVKKENQERINDIGRIIQIIESLKAETKKLPEKETRALKVEERILVLEKALSRLVEEYQKEQKKTASPTPENPEVIEIPPPKWR